MRDKKLRFCLVALTLVFVCIVVYRGALQAEFVNLDDDVYVTHNPMVRSGLSPLSISYAWTTFDTGNWIPLTWLSLELDSALFGVHPFPFHLTNVFLHTINVFLLFILFHRMTEAFIRSAVLALFFAVHPLHVESVAWVSERKDVLSTAFLLSSLLAYEWYARRPGPGRWMLVATAMVLGLLAKSMLVTLPVLLLLLDWWPLQRWQWRSPVTESPLSDPTAEVASRYPRRSWRQLIVEKTPLFVISIADGLITIAAQGATPAYGATAGINGAIRGANAVQALGWYLWKTAVPTELCVMYRHPGSDISWTWTALSFALVVIVTILVARGACRNGYRVFGWGWFIIAVMPVIGLIQVGGQAYADRYVYVPHIGFFALVVWETGNWLNGSNRQRVAAVGIAIAISLFWSVRTMQQVAVWRDSDSLWSQVLRQDPKSPYAHMGLGMQRLQQHRLDEAEAHLKEILSQRFVHDPRPIAALGTIAFERGDLATAKAYYEWVLRLKSSYAEANEAQRLAKSRLTEIAQRQPALENETVRSNHPAIRQGMAAARAGDMQNALAQFQIAIQAEPQNAGAYNNAALALAALNRIAEAESMQRQALDLSPLNPDFHVNMAVLMERKGDLSAARVHFRRAVELRPQDAEAQSRLKLLERPQAK